jgi:hypothetical protein
MTVEQCIGLVAAVYRTPLPVVFEMPLCSILAWLTDIPTILPMIEPMAGSPKQTKHTTGDELLQLAKFAGLPIVGG